MFKVVALNNAQEPGADIHVAPGRIPVMQAWQYVMSPLEALLKDMHSGFIELSVLAEPGDKAAFDQMSANLYTLVCTTFRFAQDDEGGQSDRKILLMAFDTYLNRCEEMGIKESVSYTIKDVFFEEAHRFVTCDYTQNNAASLLEIKPFIRPHFLQPTSRDMQEMHYMFAVACSKQAKIENEIPNLELATALLNDVVTLLGPFERMNDHFERDIDGLAAVSWDPLFIQEVYTCRMQSLDLKTYGGHRNEKKQVKKILKIGGALLEKLDNVSDIESTHLFWGLMEKYSLLGRKHAAWQEQLKYCPQSTLLTERNIRLAIRWKNHPKRDAVLSDGLLNLDKYHPLVSKIFALNRPRLIKRFMDSICHSRAFPLAAIGESNAITSIIRRTQYLLISSENERLFDVAAESEPILLPCGDAVVKYDEVSSTTSCFSRNSTVLKCPCCEGVFQEKDSEFIRGEDVTQWHQEVLQVHRNYNGGDRQLRQPLAAIDLYLEARSTREELDLYLSARSLHFPQLLPTFLKHCIGLEADLAERQRIPGLQMGSAPKDNRAQLIKKCYQKIKDSFKSRERNPECIKDLLEGISPQARVFLWRTVLDADSRRYVLNDLLNIKAIALLTKLYTPEELDETLAFIRLDAPVHTLKQLLVLDFNNSDESASHYLPVFQKVISGLLKDLHSLDINNDIRNHLFSYDCQSQCMTTKQWVELLEEDFYFSAETNIKIFDTPTVKALFQYALTHSKWNAVLTLYAHFNAILQDDFLASLTDININIDDLANLSTAILSRNAETAPVLFSLFIQAEPPRWDYVKAGVESLQSDMDIAAILSISMHDDRALGLHILSLPDWNNPDWETLFKLGEESPLYLSQTDENNQTWIDVYLSQDPRPESAEALGLRIVSQDQPALSNEVLLHYLEYAQCPNQNWLMALLPKNNLSLIQTILRRYPRAIYDAHPEDGRPFDYVLHQITALLDVSEDTDVQLDLAAYTDVLSRLRHAIKPRRNAANNEIGYAEDALDLVDDVLVQIDAQLAHVRENDSIHAPAIQAELQDIKMQFQRMRITDTFSCVDPASDPLSINDSQLATMTADSFASYASSTLNEDAVVSVELMQSFLLFFSQQSADRTNPLYDIQISDGRVEDISQLLTDYRDNLSQIETLRSGHVFDTACTLTPNLLLPILFPEMDSSFQKMLVGYPDDRLAHLHRDPFFVAPRTQANFDQLLSRSEKSVSDLFFSPLFQYCLHQNEDYKAAENTFLNSAWTRLRETRQLVMPSGRWEVSPDSQHRDFSMSVLKINSENKIVIQHVNGGNGSQYHAGGIQRTVSATDNNDIRAQKMKRKPYITQILDCPDEMPAWFIYLNQTQLSVDVQGGSAFKPAHFYELLWPTIGGAAPLEEDVAAQGLKCKTPQRAATSAFRNIKQLVFMALMESTTDGSVEALTKAKQDYKRLMAMLDLWTAEHWLHAQQHPDNTEQETDDYTTPLLTRELSHKIASNCMKLLKREENGQAHLNFFIFHSQKIARNLLAHSHTLDSAAEALRLENVRQLPVEPDNNPVYDITPLPSCVSTAQALPAVVLRPTLPSISLEGMSTVNGIKETLQQLKTYFDEDRLMNQPESVSATLILCHQFSVTYWQAQTALLVDNASGIDVLDHISILLSHVMQRYYNASIKQNTLQLIPKNGFVGPIQHSQKILCAYTFLALANECVRKHPRLGPHFKNHHIPIDGVQGYGHNAVHLLNLSYAGNSQERQALQSVATYWQTETQERTALFNDKVNECSLQLKVNNESSESCEMLKQLYRLMENNQEWRDSFDRKTQLLASPQHRHVHLLKNPPSVILSAWIKLSQYAQIMNIDPSYTPNNLDSNTPFVWHTNLPRLGKNYHLLIVETKHWRRPKPSVFTGYSVYAERHVLSLFNIQKRSENGQLLQPFLAESLSTKADFNYLSLLCAHPKTQLLQRLYTFLKNNTLKTANLNHQIVLKELLYSVKGAALIQESITANLELFNALLILLSAQVSPDDRSIFNVPELVFLAEIAGCFSEYAPDGCQEGWLFFQRRCRQQILAISTAAGATTAGKNLMLVTQVLLSFKPDYCIKTPADAQLYLTALCLKNKYESLGQSRFMDTVPHYQVIDNNQRLWDSLNRLTPSLLHHIVQQPQLLSAVLRTRLPGREVDFEPLLWQQDRGTPVWGSGAWCIHPISGIVFYNGMLLGGLPRVITQSADYRAYFADTQFECQQEQGGYYKSQTADAAGYTYRFKHIQFQETIEQVRVNGRPCLRYPGVFAKPISGQNLANLANLNAVLAQVLQQLKRSVVEDVGQYTVYCVENETDLIFKSENPIENPYYFYVTVSANRLIQIQQLRQWEDRVSATCIYTKNPFLIMGQLGMSDVLTESQNGYTVYSRKPVYDTREYVQIQRLSRENEQDVVETAWPHDILATELPGYINDLASKQSLNVWQKGQYCRLFIHPHIDTGYRVSDTEGNGQWQITTDSHDPTVNLFTPGPQNQAVIQYLTHFENPNYICMSETQIRLTRFALSFKLNQAGQYESVDIAGYVLDTTGSRRLFEGFPHYLKLISLQDSEDIKLIFPHLDMAQHNGDQKLTHSIVMPSYDTVLENKYFIVTFDSKSKQLKTDSLAGRLMLAFIMLGTATLKKHPLTQLNGYESASDILKTCRQNRPFLPVELKWIMAIIASSDTHRNAHAIRLKAGILLMESRQLSIFYPEEDRSLDFREMLKEDYRCYLSKIARVDESCQLDPVELQHIRSTLSASTASVSQLDKDKINSISNVSFSTLLDDLNQIHYSTIRTGPKLSRYSLQATTVESLFLSVLSDIQCARVSKEDAYYALRFLMLELTDSNNAVDLLLLQILLLISENRDEFDIPMPEGIQGQSFDFTQLDIGITSELFGILDYEICLVVNHGFLRTIQMGARTLNVPPEDYQRDWQRMMIEKAELAALTAHQKAEITERVLSRCHTIQANIKMARYVDAVAQWCERKKAQINLLPVVEPRPEIAHSQFVEDAGEAARGRFLNSDDIANLLNDALRPITTDFIPGADLDVISLAETISIIRRGLQDEHPRRYIVTDEFDRAGAPYPLASFTPETPTEMGLKNRLEESWQAYSTLTRTRYSLTQDDIHTPLSALLSKWTDYLSRVELSINEVLNLVPDNLAGWRHTLSSMQGKRPITMADTLAMLSKPDTIKQLNPFLNSSDTNILQLLNNVLILYAEIITFIHQIKRGIALCNNGHALGNLRLQNLGRTLSETRCFEIQNHPEKILFEVQNNILIRKKQNALADLMVGNTEQLCQMNMGEGKSSVVVLLILLGLAKDRKLSSVIVPDALMSDMEGLIKDKVSQNFGFLLYTFPFHRDVKALLKNQAEGEEQLETVLSQVQYCKANGYILLFSPQQRLSMHLCAQEIKVEIESAGISNDLRQRLQRQLEIFQEIDTLIDIDILDEADIILSLSKELNFTMGQENVLDGSPIRQDVAIMFMSELIFNFPHDLLGEDDSWSFIEVGNHPRVLLSNKAAYTDEIRAYFAEKLISHYFGADSEDRKRVLINACLADGLSEAILEEELETVQQLRSIRCWLSPEIVGYVLGQRFRVDYGLGQGISGEPNTHSLIAVPYKGKDTPEDNSEFEHPDVQIGFTIATHFYRGLDELACRHTLNHLSQDIYQRDIIIQSWLGLDSWAHIHLADDAQIKTITQELSHHPDVLMYYLRHIVFESTTQYSQKIGADGSMLVRRKYNGFSGTTTDALPLGVTNEIGIEDLEISTQFKATDAQNLALFANPEVIQMVDELPNDNTPALLEQLINYCDENDNVKAILDPGALITGLSNKEVAIALINGFNTFELKEKYWGIIYFDDKTDRVMVAKRNGQGASCLPYKSSQIDPQKLLTYFNDIKTRGTDRKLPPQSHAIMTIGKDMSKEKLVQAAMRMRQLGQGQALRLLIPETIRAQIIQCTQNNGRVITPVDVYWWALSNTAKNDSQALVFQGKKAQRAETMDRLLYPARIEAEDIRPHLAAYETVEAAILPLSVYDTTFDGPVHMRARHQMQVQTQTQNQAQVQVHTQRLIPQRHRHWAYTRILDPDFFNARSPMPVNAGDHSQTIQTQSMLKQFNLKGVEGTHAINRIHRSYTFSSITSTADSAHLRPVEAYLEVKDSKGRLNAILLSGEETAEVIKVLRSVAGIQSQTHCILRYISDPIGASACSAGGIQIDTLSPSQKALFVLASIYNGDSGVHYKIIGNALGQTTQLTHAAYIEIVQGFLHDMPEDSRATWKTHLQDLQESYGKKGLQQNSPLSHSFAYTTSPN